jgi:hypothetical protein
MFALLVPATVMMLSAPVVAMSLPVAPAGAILNGCNFGEYPNAPGGPSQFQVNCTFGNLATSSSQTIEDFPQAVWHNGSAWSVTAHIAGTAVVNVTGGHFNAATDLNHMVTGFGIPANTFIIQVTSPTQVVLNHVTTASALVKMIIDNSSIRSTDGAQTTSGSATITAISANFTSADVGRIVTGTNIPRYDAIASVTSPGVAVLSSPATATGANLILTIGAHEGTSSTREVTDGTVTAGSNVLTSASAGFQISDVQLPVTGCGIPAGAYITSVTDASDAVLSANATVTRPLSLADGVTTAGSTTVTSASAGFSAACDLDKGIAGAGLPAGAYVKAVTNATSVVLSVAATATATGVALSESPGTTDVIGLPSATAPVNGEAVSTVATTLTLNPTLVKGAPPCAAGDPSGETIEGAWYNPGGYLANTLAPAPKFLPTNTIGQIVYPTAVVSFSDYVVNVAANTTGELDTAAHTDVVYPFIPIGMALCSSPLLGIGSQFSFEGSTLAQQKLAIGQGRPNSAFVRAVNDLGSGVSTTTGTAYLINGMGSSPYSGTCTTNFPAAISDLPCH